MIRWPGSLAVPKERRSSSSATEVLPSTAAEVLDVESPRYIRSLGSLTLFPGISSSTINHPLSALLLRCHIQKISKIMVAKPAEDNPSVNILLRLAYFDDLLMSTVLALSGQHLLGNQGPNVSLQRATRHHYGLALQKLIVATGDLRDVSGRGTLRLLLVTLVVCNVEVSLQKLQSSSFRR